MVNNLYALCRAGFQAYVPCAAFYDWPVYNQHHMYQCVQMSHAGNDKYLYIFKYYKYEKFNYF